MDLHAEIFLNERVMMKATYFSVDEGKGKCGSQCVAGEMQWVHQADNSW